MRYVTFTESGSTRIGVINDRGVIDLSVAAPDLPSSMRALIEAGPDAWAVARDVAEGVSPHYPLDAVRLEAPIGDPGKVLAIGLNYGDHIKESGMEAPKHQVWFNKQRNCITGPCDPVDVPSAAPDYVDYEAELCIVIGRHCRHVPRERAREVIFGYTCGNDVSVRDWQMRTPTMTMGKSFATHGPIGPWIVTPDEFGDPHDAGIRCYVNGELRQESNTAELIYDCYDQIAELTRAFPLDPGDVLFTGTPHGVGAAMKPPKFLKAGDVVRVEIDRIGAIENPLLNENARTMIGDG
ncbi:MAG: fumarylacetoacetate hydrolase family protein [Pseudomonadales bacterium]|nr:fumarylacetoacetate hydrolase family protein [Pseudomonadales bacterium]